MLHMFWEHFSGFPASLASLSSGLRSASMIESSTNLHFLFVHKVDETADFFILRQKGSTRAPIL